MMVDSVFTGTVTAPRLNAPRFSTAGT